jgi:hypothetical protein
MATSFSNTILWRFISGQRKYSCHGKKGVDNLQRHLQDITGYARVDKKINNGISVAQDLKYILGSAVNLNFSLLKRF